MTRRRQALENLDREIQEHIEEETRENIARGMMPDDARNAARRAFGNIAQVKEDTRAVWIPVWLDQLLQDVRYGLRLMRKSPGFTLAVIFSLALGIGANTAIFSLIDAVMLRMLPVKDPQQLVSMTDPTAGGVFAGLYRGQRPLLSSREFEALRDRAQSFSGVFAASSLEIRNGSIDYGIPEQVKWRLVSGNYFNVLGTSAFLGRTFTAEDEHGPGTASYAIGVAEPQFLGENIGDAPDIWIPLDMQPQIMPGQAWLEDDPSKIAQKVIWLHVIGRLKPAVSRARAQAEVDVVFKHILEQEFSPFRQSQPEVLRATLKLHDVEKGISSRARPQFAESLYVLMGIAGLVLVIACSNVAALLLARAAAHRKEMGVRLSLGASRARILRQCLTESMVLFVAGALIGGLFAVSAVPLFIQLATDPANPITLDIHPDLRMLLFTLGTTLLTGITVGLAPAYRSTRVNVNDVITNVGDGLRSTNPNFSAGKILVIGQVAFSVIVLVGTGWFVRTLRNLQNVDLGYPRQT